MSLDTQYEDLEDSYASLSDQIESFQEELEQKLSQLQEEKSAVESKLRKVSGDIDDDALQQFVDKPYTIVPKSNDEVLVIVPRFIPFTLGWLERQDESYNHFLVNKYVNWIEEIPADIQDKVGISQEYSDVEVDGKQLSFSSEAERDKAWSDLGGRGGGLHKRDGDTDIQIQSGSEFDVIANIIEGGNLPFKPHPVEEPDLRSEEPTNLSLREYQEDAWTNFCEKGHVGVFWPPGAGKTYLSLYAGERIRGKKLVIVPQSTLEEQWESKIEEVCTHPEEWDVRTYQYLTYGDNLEQYPTDDLTLTIMDEVHHIPSTTYSKLALIDTKYRLGLSATPYREEDGTTKYIFALTGYPIGLDWETLSELGVTKYPDVQVHLFTTTRKKRSKLTDLVHSETGKLVVFCDSIETGKKLSRELDVPFIHGETSNRLDIFESNRVVISSRVGDEGLSIENIDTVIEYDFHGSSRRQELQRAGRVMHNSSSTGKHHLLMTDDEYQKSSDRLLSLEQRGFDVSITRQ